MKTEEDRRHCLLAGLLSSRCTLRLLNLTLLLYGNAILLLSLQKSMSSRIINLMALGCMLEKKGNILNGWSGGHLLPVWSRKADVVHRLTRLPETNIHSHATLYGLQNSTTTTNNAGDTTTITITPTTTNRMLLVHKRQPEATDL